jgi:cell division protein FtsN
MSETHFREIQLSGKQLVFLFMTSVVVAVGVFLLGVSVGRGVRTNTVGAGIESIEQSAAVEAPAELPPEPELTPADTGYHDTLQGTTTPQPEPEPSEPAAATPAASGQAPAPAPAPAAVAPPPPTAPVVASKPAPAVSDGWFLQVGAFRSRENADRQVQQLVAKGYAASVASGAAGGLYRVRVGPFAARDEAERNAARLSSQEGIKSSVTR